jgi:PfaB family protein
MIDPSQRVAIVGIGGVFPGAPDLQGFWDLVAGGLDATTDVPEGRWLLDPGAAYDPAVGTPDRVYSTRGGFIEGFRFDPEGLALDPGLGNRLDPMFQLALHAGRAAWRDAKTEELDRSRVGVVFGNIVLPTETASAIASETLGRTLAERVLGELAAEVEPKLDPTEPLNRFAAGLPAGLLARALGLGGGAFTLDAACASSLYALKLAADELLSGRVDAMVTGGLSRPDPLYTQMGFSQLRALSASGRARPFDGKGDGLVVGEGAGMFVLKRLDDALRQGDHVYGIVAAVGLSNDVDGGLLAPSSEGQLRAMRAAYERAGWDPHDVDLIECHATGTPVGDAVEFESLKELWGQSGWTPGRCVIGSHKANIGHTLTASGAAGLLKVLLALRQKQLPPTANFTAPGPKVDLAGSPFRILTRAETWSSRASGTPRRAAVSGFGFGGINAHALIEEWVPVEPEKARAGAPAGTVSGGELVPMAVVGLGAHFGPFRGLRAVQERVLGGVATTAPTTIPHDWGVSESEWARREGLALAASRGYHLEELALPTDRFRIPPKELEEMLPQQSLALLAAADAIDDAGWDRGRPQLRAGVFIGIGLDLNTTNYHIRWSVDARVREWERALGLGLDDDERTRWANDLRNCAGPPLTANRTMGALGGLIASRVAREFHIGGPSFTVSSEETSGLKALEVAVRLLRQGDLDEAVVGAVDLTGDPRVRVTAHRSGCDDLTRGDGAAALVLKRLDDATRDGDRVYAVIRDVASSSGGHIDADELDEALLSSAREQTSVPEDRLAGNADFLDTLLPERCSGGGSGSATVTPIESQLGHTGAATALGGLLRAILSVYQEILPPGPEALPRRDDTTVGDPTTSRTAPRYWLRDREKGPRQAIVEALGVDGGCVRIGLEEALRGSETRPVTVERVQPLGASEPALFAIEADDVSGLSSALTELETLTATCDPSSPIEAIARRWWATRPNDPKKRLGLALLADKPDSLREAINEGRQRLASPTAPPTIRPKRRAAIHFSDRPVGSDAEMAFVFPGIGNHFPGMARDLSARWPEVFRKLDGETLRLRSQILPAAAWDAGSALGFDDHRAPILAQVVLGTAVSDLLRSFGVEPDAVVGYSLGESSALFATRAWTSRDEMHARLDASPLFRNELCGPCDAARRAWPLAPSEPVDWLAGIVPAPAGDVRAALAGLDRAYLLIVNTPAETVVGGDRRQVLRLIERLGLAARFVPLPVVSTVHCPIAREVEDAYRTLHTLDTNPPESVRFYSAGWGRSYVPDRATAAEAIVAQALDTVDFPRVVNRAYDDGVRIFIETGPGASCSRMISATLGDRPHLARSACLAGVDGVANLLDLLASLIAHRVPLDLRSLYGNETRAVGLASERPDDQMSARRLVRVPVGGEPFAVPPLPSPSNARSTSSTNGYEAHPTVSDLPRVTSARHVESAATTRAASTAMALEPAPSMWPPETADPLTNQVLATETARARAHESFLRVSGGLAEAMADQLALQMALVEALSTAPVDPSTAFAAPDHPGQVEPPRQREDDETRPVLTREECLEFAVGSIGKVLGSDFAAVDAYPTRVRLPDEPLMLVDRITAIEGEPHSMSSGRVVTEHDILPGDWYLDCGKIPPCIAIESGQADLFLSAWLGVDFVTRGLAVYRLLDAAVTFHRALPGPGEMIRYDIRIERFFRQGDMHLFRFAFEGSVDGEPLLTMRDGCAGFFTDEALAAGQGIVSRPLDLRPLPGKRPDDWHDLVPNAVESYDDDQVEALRRGDFASAFGEAFEGLGVSDPVRLPGGRMTLVHRVPVCDPTGGRFGLGLIRTELDIHPGDWFLTCHFIDDRVMPGTLMYECCLHALRIFLSRMGWVWESAGVAYEPVPGVASRLRCRGQVIESTRKAVFEVVIKEVGYRPEPYAIADAMMYSDGKAIVEVVDMTLRLTGLSREKVEQVWAHRSSAASNPATSAPRQAPPLFTREQVIAFATGRPSEAFGERYRPFDRERFVARLPAPPYSFIDRVVSATAEPFVMASGGEAVAEYDVPPDAWYFASERHGRMPFAVLQEVALQACGWTSAFMGSALHSQHDLAFRNLGGEAVALDNVTPRSGTLTTRVKVTRVSNSAGMVLQHYDFETRAGATEVYRGSTYFGFFQREALADQVGIREAVPYQATSDELARARSFDYPADAPFPDATLRMIDRVEAFVADGGPHGLGFIAGSLAVNPEAWYFKAHFYQDPVCPGSLGLESFLQLLKVVACERWGTAASRGPLGFEPVGLGRTHRWLYRGQIVPIDRSISVQAVITAVEDQQRLVTADGHLSVDGRVIYEMTGFSLRVISTG